MSDREKLIRDAWDWFKQTGYGWPKDMPHLNVPIPTRATDIICDPMTTKKSYLTFEMEHGRMDGVPMGRIVCEGVVVEMFRL